MSIARKLSKLAKFLSHETQVGIVNDFAGQTAPTGWLMCYGQAVSRTQYAALFAVIGTAYGAGDGSTTFNVPDARGRVIAGKDNMGGVAANRLTTPVAGSTLGAAGGAQSHTLTAGQMPAHAHGVNDPGHAHSVYDPGHQHSASYDSARFNGGGGIARLAGMGNADGWVNNAVTGIGIYSAATGVSIQNNGGGEAHPNVQPTLVLNKIIFAGV